MKISVSSKILWNKNIVNVIELVKERGFDGLEIWVEHLWRDVENLKSFKQYLLSSGLSYTLHGAVYDINIASCNPYIRKASVEQIRRSIETCALLEAPVLTIHPGRLSSSKGDMGLALKRQLESLYEIMIYAEGCGIYIGLENMEDRKKEILLYPSDFKELFLQIQSKYLGVTLDLAHLMTLKRPDPLKYMESFSPLFHVHLSDSTPNQVHLPMGKGEVDLPSLLERLYGIYNGTITIEGYTPGEELTNLYQVFKTWRELCCQLDYCV